MFVVQVCYANISVDAKCSRGEEEFVDIKNVIRIRKSERTDNTMPKREKTKGQTMI